MFLVQPIESCQCTALLCTIENDDVQLENNGVSFLISSELDIVDTANEVSHFVPLPSLCGDTYSISDFCSWRRLLTY